MARDLAPPQPPNLNALLSGAFYALLAGALWGLVFIAPLVLPTWGALEIAGGRYVVYALFSAVMLGIAGRTAWPRPDVWWMAAKLTFMGSLVYYSLVLFGIQRAGAPLITLIIGVLPITMAVAGNLDQRSTSVAWGKLAIPTVTILAGLGLVHGSEHGSLGLSAGSASSEVLIGIVCGVGALVAWTWYGVRNATYMASRPDVSATTMASLQGLTLLPLVLPLLAVLLIGRTSTPAGLDNLSTFALASLALGIGPSWLAGLFWIRASQRLPPALLGQLIVFETLFGLIYAFLWRGAWPTLGVVAGGALLVLGVLLGLRVFVAPNRT